MNWIKNVRNITCFNVVRKWLPDSLMSFSRSVDFILLFLFYAFMQSKRQSRIRPKVLAFFRNFHFLMLKLLEIGSDFHREPLPLIYSDNWQHCRLNSRDNLKKKLTISFCRHMWRSLRVRIFLVKLIIMFVQTGFDGQAISFPRLAQATEQ